MIVFVLFFLLVLERGQCAHGRKFPMSKSDRLCVQSLEFVIQYLTIMRCSRSMTHEDDSMTQASVHAQTQVIPINIKG